MKAPDTKKNAEILLIEDNPIEAAGAIKIIEHCQLPGSVLWLEDGIQAMDYLNGTGVFTGRNAKITPNMIFLDTKMPRKSGLEVLHEIRTTPGLKNIPVVLLCSTERELRQVKNYDLNINNYILKPLDSSVLTNVINSYNQPVDMNNLPK